MLTEQHNAPNHTHTTDTTATRVVIIWSLFASASMLNGLGFVLFDADSGLIHSSLLQAVIGAGVLVVHSDVLCEHHPFGLLN